MTSSLPLVGAQAVILGMAAFQNNSRTVNTTLRSIGQSAYYLQRTSARAMQETEASFTGAFGSIIRLSAIAASAIATMAAGAVILGQRYGSELNFIGTIGDVTSGKLEALNQKQLELSRTTTTSALEISKASGELVKAGVEIDKVLDTTLKYTNAMVVLSNKELDAARAAGIMQVSLKTFKASAEDAAKAATAAVQRSLLTFVDYADAIRQVGGVAAQNQMTLQQTAAIIGVLGQQLDSGTEIGTGFRMMLQKLKDPTKEDIALMKQYKISLFDVNEAARPIFDVIRDMEIQFGKSAVTTGKITQATRDHALAMLFDGRTAKTVAVLLDQGTEAYLEMLDAIERTDVIKLQEQILSDTGRTLEIVGHNVQDLGIAFAQGLDPAINAASRSILRWLQSIDINKVRAFGREIAGNLYASFRTIQSVVLQNIPVIHSFANVLMVALAGIAVRAVLVAFIAMTTALNAWLGRLAFAAAYHTTYAAIVVASFVRAMGAVVLAIGTQIAAFSLWVDALIYNATLVTAVWLPGILKAMVLSTAAVLANIGKQIAAVVVWGVTWVATHGMVAATVAAHVAGIVIALALMGAAYTANAGLAIIAGTGIALMYTATLMPAIIKYGAVVIASMLAASTALIAHANVALVVVAAAMRRFHIIVLNAMSGVARATIFASIAAGRALITNLAGAVIFATTASLAALAPFVLGIGAIAGVIYLVAQAWARNWGDIQGVVARAVGWILEKLNGFLDELAKLPLIGEMVPGIRAGVGAFFGNLPAFVVTASNAVASFVRETVEGFKSIKSVDLDKEFSKYERELAELEATAKTARDELAAIGGPRPDIQVPAVGSEPGFLPDESDAEKAAKAFKAATERAEELVRDFHKEVRKENEEVANDLAQLYQRAGDDMAINIERATKDINDTIEDSLSKIAELEQERDLQASEERRTDALEEMLDAEEQFRREGLENAEVVHQRELEDAEEKYRKIQDAAERANDEILAAAERTREETRDEEDRAFDRLQRDRENNLDKLLKIDQDTEEKRLDGLEDALDTRQDAEQKALDKTLDARELALKKEQDLVEQSLERAQQIREDALEAQLDAEKRIREETADLGEIERKDAEARAKAEAEYATELSIGVKQSIAQARLNEKIADIQEDTNKARAAFEKRKVDAVGDLAFEAEQEGKLQALREQFESENLALKERSEAASLELREKNEDEMLRLRAEHERQALQLREDNESAMTRLHEEHEKRRDEFSRTLEIVALQRSKDRAKEDRDFADEQERKKREFAEQQAAAALKERRRIEDAENVRKRALDLAETDFKKTQEEKRDALSKAFEDEAYQRRLVNIRLEHDKKIAQIEATLAEEQTKTQAKLAQDVTDLNHNLEERIKSMRENYIDRLDDILRAGGAAMQPAIDRITGQIEEGLQGIRDAANEAVTALTEVLSKSDKVATAQAGLGAAQSRPGGGGGGGNLPAPLREGGKPGETQAEVDNFNKNVAAAAAAQHVAAAALAGLPGLGGVAAIASALGFQYGGKVPGRFGEAVPVMAHGGEQYEGIGAYGIAMTAVRMAEAMWQRGTQGGGGTVYNNSNTVNANYGHVQPEGSIMRDLSALEMLTRK